MAFPFLQMAFFVGSLICLPAASTAPALPAANGFALIELFTSEGCNSCPAADEALAEISREYKSNVYVLGFHVDYWNTASWKDAYSKADYSQRQKDYALFFALSSIYTPQVIVNGTREFTGSDKTRLRQAIENGLRANSGTNLRLSVAAGHNDEIIVRCQAANTGDSQLHIALVQLKAETQVTGGENRGRLLHHLHIVRDFRTLNINGAAQVIPLQLPAGLSKTEVSIIAFTQSKSTRQVLAAAQADIP